MTASINVYNMPKTVTLTLGGNTGAALMDYPVNTTDFTLVKGITNELYFFVKDTDRHPITANSVENLGISDIRIVITDPKNDILYLGSQTNPVAYNDPSVMIPADNIDPAKGVWFLSIPASVIANFPTGYLRYSVICDRYIGDQVMLYTDRNYGHYGTCKVTPGPFPNPPEAITILANAFTNRSSQTVQSGSYLGAASVNNINGDMSAVIQMVGFTGTVTVQGSLENQPSSNDSDWFTANTTSISNGVISNGMVVYNNAVTGPAYIGFNGNNLWTRFIINTETGSFTEVDYRAD